MKRFSVCTVVCCLLTFTCGATAEEPPKEASQAVSAPPKAPGEGVVQAFAQELRRKLLPDEERELHEVVLRMLEALRANSRSQGGDISSAAQLGPVTGGGGALNGGVTVLEQTQSRLLKGFEGQGAVTTGALMQLGQQTMQELFGENRGRVLTSKERTEVRSAMGKLSTQIVSALDELSNIRAEASNVMRPEFRARLVRATDEKVVGAFVRLSDYAKQEFKFAPYFEECLGFPMTLEDALDRDRSDPLDKLREVERALRENHPLFAIAANRVSSWCDFLREIRGAHASVRADLEIVREFLGIKSVAAKGAQPKESAKKLGGGAVEMPHGEAKEQVGESIRGGDSDDDTMDSFLSIYLRYEKKGNVPEPIEPFMDFNQDEFNSGVLGLYRPVYVPKRQYAEKNRQMSDDDDFEAMLRLWQKYSP